MMEKCFLVSIDCNGRDEPCATIMEENRKGYSLAKVLYSEEADALYFQMTGKHLEDSQNAHLL